MTWSRTKINIHYFGSVKKINTSFLDKSAESQSVYSILYYSQ